MQGDHPFARRAPAERLAAFRIAVGVFVLVYLVGRSAVFLELGDRGRDRFEPVGVFALIDRPLGAATNTTVLVVAVVGAVAVTVGWRCRIMGPIAAIALLVMTSHRSSWGQLLHFENLMTLQLLIVGVAPAASDVWSLDARRRGATGPGRPPSDRYGWPLQLASVVVVTTYAIAGVAKLRYGGIDWMAGDTLRNHIAYSYARLDVLGGSGSPLAPFAVRNAGLLPWFATVSVLIELSAPVALLGRRTCNVWVAAAWAMHVSIFALMLVGFPSPLFLVGFASLFPLERGVRRVLAVAGRWPWVQPIQAGRLDS